jgi:hypothetical protein
MTRALQKTRGKCFEGDRARENTERPFERLGMNIEYAGPVRERNGLVGEGTRRLIDGCGLVRARARRGLFLYVCMGLGVGMCGYVLVFDRPSIRPRWLLYSSGIDFLLAFSFFSFVGSISPHLPTMYTSSPSSRYKRHGALLLRYVLLPGHDISRLEAVLGRPI